ncbi:MAG: HEPN domain-containing protein [Phascolarctobacterium sp.]
MAGCLKDLAKYRFECCEEALLDAKLMYDNGRYKNTLNRAYYAIFYAIRSVNALQDFDSSKHSGVIAFFNQTFVKEGIFPKEASKIIKLASENRERADYLDFFIASKKDAEEQLQRAEKFKNFVDEYLQQKGIL